MVTVVGLEFERSNFFVIFLPHKPGGVASIKVFEVTLFRISHLAVALFEMLMLSNANAKQY